MKKVFILFAGIIICVLNTTPLFPSKAESPVEQLVSIMVPNQTSSRYEWVDRTDILINRNDYDRVYEIATKYPELLKGYVYTKDANKGTFAMLCIKRGYVNLLECLINEGYPVDLATPCYLLGPDNPPTTVLYELIVNIGLRRQCSFVYQNRAFDESAIRLAKLIIQNNPDVLDITFHRAGSPRDKIREYGLGNLIPPDLRQNAN